MKSHLRLILAASLLFVPFSAIADVVWPALCNDPAVPAQLSGLGIGLRRGFHLQRLMRALLVVKLDPVANHSTGML